MSKKKKSRLTRVMSYLHSRKYLDEDCFENGEINEEDYWDDDEETAKKNSDRSIDLAAMALIFGGGIAAFVLVCSVVYYGVKGTAGLFRAIGNIVKH